MPLEMDNKIESDSSEETPIQKRKRLLEERMDRLKDPNLTLTQKMTPSQEDLDQAKESLGMVMGSMQAFGGGVPAAGNVSAEAAREAALKALSRPGLANNIKYAAMKSGIPQMAEKPLIEAAPEGLSLVDRIKFAKLKSWGKL